MNANELEWLKLDKHSRVPMYEQLRQGIYSAILEGRLPGGTKLPTEAELCEQYGVSRPVARQAYNALIESGYIRRLRGRGTYVHTPEFWERFLNRQISYANEMKIMGMTPKTELLNTEWLNYAAATELFERMELKKSDQLFHVTRMRYANDNPFVLVENFVPGSLLPKIDAYDYAENSLYEIMETVYGEKVVRSRRAIMAETADRTFSELFGVPIGSPIFHVDNLSYDQYDRAVDFSKEYMDGKSQKFEFDVVNQ